MKDLYQILGVARAASQKDIKNAYQQKAVVYHPDKNQNAHAKEDFIALHEAYKILLDPSTRAEYDRVINSKNQIKDPSSYSTNFTQKSTQAKQEAEEYAKHFSMYSSKVLKKTIWYILKDIFMLLLGAIVGGFYGSGSMYLMVFGVYSIIIPYIYEIEGYLWLFRGIGVILILGGVFSCSKDCTNSCSWKSI